MIERIVKTGCRMSLNCYDNSSYDLLFKRLGWCSLATEERELKLKIMFKNMPLLEGKTLEIFNFITLETSRRSTRLSHEKQLKVFCQRPRLTRTQVASIPTMVRLWNSLPSDAIQCTSLESFTKALKQINWNMEEANND